MSITRAREASSSCSPSTFSFDLEAYISRYPEQSETRLQRLLFIHKQAKAKAEVEAGDTQGKESNYKQLSEQAKSLALEQIKATQNIIRYKELVGTDSDEYFPFDQAENDSALEALEERLSLAQAHLNKEAIRTAYLAKCAFHRPRGEWKEAMRAVLRSRDYCTNRNQTAHVCLLIMELAMDMGNYAQVHDYVAKAEHSIIPGDMSFPIKLKVASGLADLAQGHFKESAEALCSTFGTAAAVATEDILLCAPEDVALYGALVGLATLSREKLSTLLDSPLLELVPKIKECLSLYCRADYRGSIDILDELHPLFTFDMHLEPHLVCLTQTIRNKALVDYLKPYKRVSLVTMATTFSMTVPDLTNTLATLIGNGSIVGRRISSRTQTLDSTMSCTTHDKKQEAILALQNRVLNDSYACMIRMACMELDQSVVADGGSGRRGYSFRESSDEDEVMEQVVANADEFY